MKGRVVAVVTGTPDAVTPKLGEFPADPRKDFHDLCPEDADPGAELGGQTQTATTF